MSIESQNDKKVADFLAGKRVLVVDTDATTRTTTQRMLTTMQIPNKNVLVAWSYHDALHQIEQFRPEIVLTDYVLERHSGIDLLNAHKRVLPERLRTVFMFISSRNSNTIACLAASEEVDAFIIKPFSFSALKDKFLEVLSAKAYAPDYLREVEKARFQIHEKRYPEALATLANAKTLDGAPALACYFEGSINHAQGNIDEALVCYHEGLRFNPVHYRSLNGLLQLLIEKRRFDEAYEVAHKLTQNYPIEPALIPVLIRLSISSRNFEDILKYFEVFDAFEEKDPSIVSYISAGLVVCAKHFFENGRQTDGMNALLKAESISDRRTQIMKEILATLLGAGLEEEAKAFLERAPAEVKNSPEVNAARLEKLNTSAPPSRVLQHALDMLVANIKHPRIYEIALLRSVELQHRDTHIRQLVEQASKAFPERRHLFESIASGVSTGSGGGSTSGGNTATG